MHVLAVSFEPAARIATFRVEEPLGVPLLLDPERCAYRSFGFETGSAGRVWTLSALARYVRAAMRGERIYAPSGDTHQLGGDVVIDATNVVRWVRASHSPTDRPSAAELSEALRLAGGAFISRGETA